MSNFAGLTKEEKAHLLPDNMILLGYRGSIAHGMYLNPDDHNSVDDKDLMGVCFGPSNSYFGDNKFEQREAVINEWDSVVYECRKMIRLLKNANPNVLSLLWLNDNHYLIREEGGQELINNRYLFATKRIYKAFTGYAYGQLKRMTHNAHEGYMGEKRKNLVKEYGYDTKNASHLIRLLKMGIEFLNEGELYVFRHDAPQLMDIKRGLWTLEEVQAEAKRLFVRAEEAYDRCKLPNFPDDEAIDDLGLSIIGGYWNEKL